MDYDGERDESLKDLFKLLTDLPYKQSGKIEHRAWFSPEEYQTLYEHTRERGTEG